MVVNMKFLSKLMVDIFLNVKKFFFLILKIFEKISKMFQLFPKSYTFVINIYIF